MTFIGRIRYQAKRTFDTIRNEKLKYNLLQAIPFWIASLLTGLVAVVYTRLFALAEKGTAYIVHLHLWLLFLITPVTFVLAWWLVRQFAPYARGSGIPQVMASIELATPKYNAKVNQLLSLRIVFIKILSSLIMAFGGGVIGREGPTIQVAGSIFRKVNEWLPKWWPKVSKRNMIMTGAAAGLAAAFNTPLGGIVFAVEELTRTHISYFKTALFTAVIIAGLTAQALLGPYLYLGYPDVSHLSGSIFFGVILVAIPSGLGGAFMAQCMLKLFKWKATFTLTRQHVFYVVGCALIIAGLAFFIDERVLGSGKELMTTALFTNQKYNSWYMPLLRIIRPIFFLYHRRVRRGVRPGAQCGRQCRCDDLGLDAPVALRYQPDHIVRDGRLSDGSHPNALYFGYPRAGNDGSPQCDSLHLMLAGMTASLVAMAIDRHSFYDHLKYQYLREIVGEDAPEITHPQAEAIEPEE